MSIRRTGAPPGVRERSPLRGRVRRISGSLAFVLIAEAALLATAGTGTTAVADDSPAAGSSATSLGAAEAQDEASALLMARLQNRRIEVLSERTSTATTWALPDGTLRTDTYAGPVRVKQDGRWQDIDTSLSDTGDDLQPEAAAADIAVSDGGDRQLASVTKGKESFGLGWQEKLPNPKVKEDTASYDLGDGQTLKVTALAQGFSENIALTQQPDAAVSYRIPLDLRGLKLSQADSGHLLLKDGDGKLVAEAPAPMMWDSSHNDSSGEPEHSERVDTRIETASDGSQTLVLSPDKGFLATATYPVTVDPTSTLAVTTDTWVQTPDYPDSQVSSAELKSGTYDGGTDKARSYLKFDVSKFSGKHILDTNLALYSYYSSTCSTSGAGTQVRRITSTWSSSDVTWSTQPSTTTTDAVTNKAALGYSSSCAAGTMNFDIDGIVQAWADGSANYGLQVRGADETDSTTWRRFRSANYVSGDNSVEPHLTVTYNSYAVNASAAIAPSVVNAYNGKRYVTSLTPTLTAKVTDADGSSVKGQFEVTADPAYADTTYSYTGTSPSVSSGSTVKLTVPSDSAFPAAKHLRFRVRGYDGTDYGSWSGYTAFALNTGLPTAPAVSCETYDEQTWTAKAGSAVDCTLDTSSADGQGYYWSLDDPNATSRVDDTADGNGGDALTVSISPDNGWHTLYAKTVDSGGNLSAATTAYTFGVGADGAAVTSPKEGTSTARRVTLSARGRTSYTSVTWYYRTDGVDDWVQVPAGDVVTASSGTAVTWPVSVTAGKATDVIWNVASTLGVDTDLDVRATFTDGTTPGNTQSVGLTLDRAAGAAPQKKVGPGQVNLLTGNYTLSETDVSLLGLTAQRTASSRVLSDDVDSDTLVPVFGNGWVAGQGADVQAARYSRIDELSAGSIRLTDMDGETVDFAKGTSGWTSGDVTDVTLTGAVTGTTFTLSDATGTVATYTQPSGSTTVWLLDTVADTSSTDEIDVSQAVITGDTVLARPKYAITGSGTVSAKDCFTDRTVTGCRALEYVYADSTTATSSTDGDYTGRVKRINLWAADPGASTATSTAVAAYAYNTAGRLTQAWDPRVPSALKTTYGYDSDSRVTSYTRPGRLAWTFTYGSVGDSATAGAGMLLTASHPALAAGSASSTAGTSVTTVVYDVPLSGSNAPHQMTSGDVGSWGQGDRPTDAAAVFSADNVPASSLGSDLNSSNYRLSTISYLDPSGNEVDTATDGGHLISKDYDAYGNVVRELSAANRELALGTADGADTELARLGISGYSTADRAERLSTRYVYSDDGTEMKEEYGPLHRVTLQNALSGGVSDAKLAAGTEIPARKHATYTYDEGRPAGSDTQGLVTSTTTGASVDGYPGDADKVTVSTEYDWNSGLPTKTVTDPSGLALTTSATYTSSGSTATSTVPGPSASQGVRSTTTYWSGSGSGDCSGHAEWAGWTCQVTTASVSGGAAGETVVKTVTYDRWGNQVKVTETSSATARVTTYTYDGAGRLTRTSVSAGTGTTTPDTTRTYNTSNGLVATITTNGRTAAYGYDKLGRVISYDDGSGNTVTTSYDALDRRTKVSDSVPSSTSYAYGTTAAGDSVVTVADSIAGTFTLTHGVDGRLESGTLADGSTLAVSYDEAGNTTTRAYSASDGTAELSDNASYTVQDQRAHESRTAGTTSVLDYSYDRAGRLTQTAVDEGTTCTTRAYTVDAAGNRTQSRTSTANCADGADSTSSTATALYDAMGRAGAFTYDALGEATQLDDGTAVGYFTNGTAYQSTKGTDRVTWSVDAEARPSVATVSSNTTGTWTQASVTTTHFGAGTSLPSWSTDGTTVVRWVTDPEGNLLATTGATKNVVLQLTDLHGDVGVELSTSDGSATVHSYTEYGATDASARYGWFGNTLLADRQASGLVLVRGRLYQPATGRFLQPDIDGAAYTTYTLDDADPVNALRPTATPQ